MSVTAQRGLQSKVPPNPVVVSIAVLALPPSSPLSRMLQLQPTSFFTPVPPEPPPLSLFLSTPSGCGPRDARFVKQAFELLNPPETIHASLKTCQVMGMTKMRSTGDTLYPGVDRGTAKRRLRLRRRWPLVRFRFHYLLWCLTCSLCACWWC